uniref:RdRp n=1 Tax=viral metagenome TaxID=1070528 RepID=A0A2V0R9T8_9ZZZZ
MHPIDFIDTLDKKCLEAGQKMGTVGDATIGRGVHFLQKYYIGGQEISRRIAYDHENEVAGKILTGDVSSYLTKAKLIASRGGNLDSLNMLQLMTVINGSRSTQFGRQSDVSFRDMACPGGFTNQVLLGFSGDNSQLYLELNSDNLFGPGAQEIAKRPKLEKTMTTGRRVVEAHGSTLATATIGGSTTQATVDEFIASSTRLLTEPERMSPRTALLQSFFEASRLDEISYVNAVRGAAHKVVGESLQVRSLRPKFIEKALLQSGLIGRDLKETPEPVKTSSTLHSGYRINNYTFTFSLSREYYMKLPTSTSPGENTFCLYEIVHGSPVLRNEFSQQWHPFYALPDNYRMVCSLFGVTGSPHVLVDVSQHTGLFSPDRFRVDMTKEEVINMIKLTKHDHSLAQDMLLFIGFKTDECERILSNIDLLSQMEEIEDTAEYSSIPDVLKCVSITRISEILMTTSPNASVISDLPPTIKKTLYTHYLALMSDEINVACSLRGDAGTGAKYIRLPAIDVKYRS